MEKILTPSGEGKLKLQKQAEKAKVREEAEKKAEQERKKRQKKLQERMMTAFLAYAKAAREEELHRSREEALKLQRDFYLQQAEESRRKTERILFSLTHHDDFIGSFFEEFENREPEEKTGERNALLQGIGMEKKDYHVLALSAALQDEEHREEAVHVLCGDPCADQTKADSLRKKALSGTDRILCAFRDGNSDTLRKLLTENLKNSCREFAQAPDPVVALHWARHIGNIVSIIEHKNILSKEEKDSRLYETAVGISAMGRVMEVGYEAMLKMQNSLLEGTALNEEEEALLQAQILLMQQVDQKRSSPAYQEYFADSERSEKRSPEENMKRVLDQLSKSSILQQLSSMSPEEKCFAFSDEESRKYLANELFGELKKQPVQEPPQKAAELPSAVKKA